MASTFLYLTLSNPIPDHLWLLLLHAWRHESIGVLPKDFWVFFVYENLSYVGWIRKEPGVDIGVSRRVFAIWMRSWSGEWSLVINWCWENFNESGLEGFLFRSIGVPEFFTVCFWGLLVSWLLVCSFGSTADPLKALAQIQENVLVPIWVVSLWPFPPWR